MTYEVASVLWSIAGLLTGATIGLEYRDMIHR